MYGKLEPGTSGYFDIIIDTTDSEVDIDYKVSFENEQGKPSNLVFTYNDVDFESLKSLENVLSGSITANSLEKIKVFPIDWRWEYQTGSNEKEIQKNNEIDTKDAMNNSDYTFDIVVTGTQTKPQKS